MLNPERVDFCKDLIEIGLSSDGIEVLQIVLTESDAYNLGKMIIEQTNLKAKRKRRQKGIIY